MTLLYLAWRRMAGRPVSTGLNLLLIALAVAAVAALLLVGGQADRALTRNAAAADGVVGGRTSGVQLVLAGLFHVESPPAPFDLAALEPALNHPTIQRWVPLALGDSVQGFRVVGTRVPDFAGLYDAPLHSGRWPQVPGDVLLGADVLRVLGVSLGAELVTTHGLSPGGEAHGHLQHRVVGTLARTGTVLDKLILTPLESVWRAHAEAPGATDEPGHADEEPSRKVSLVLVRSNSPLGLRQLARRLADNPGLQVATAAVEVVRLRALTEGSAELALWLGACLFTCAALAVGAGLLAAQRERMQDVALLRLLGASPLATAGLLLTEALFLGLTGAGLGLLAAHGLVHGMVTQLPASAPPLTGWTLDPREPTLVAAAVLVAVVGGLLPAWRVQRQAVADVLRTA